MRRLLLLVFTASAMAACGSENQGPVAGEDVRVAASRVSETIERKASEGAEKVTSMVRGGGSDAGNGSFAP